MPDFSGFLLSDQTILELMEARKLLEISNVEVAAIVKDRSGFD